MTLWNTLCIVSAVVFVLAILILIVFNFRKNVYYKPYEADELYKTTIDAGVKNYIYSTHAETKEYIKRYVIRKSAYDNSIICNFNKNYEQITYFVIQYSRRNKVLSVTEVTERKTNNSSKIITISKRCKNVNIVVKSVEGLELNTRMILPLSTAKIRLFSLFSTLAFLSALFVVRHLLVTIICYYYSKTFFETIYNYISLIAIFGFSLAYYVLSVLTLRKKSAKSRNGGALEYDFL